MELAADREVRRALGRGVALIMVSVVRDTGRSAKANVSMDASTLQAIDEEARARVDALGLHCQRRAGEDSARDLINQSPSPNAKRGPLRFILAVLAKWPRGPWPRAPQAVLLKQSLGFLRFEFYFFARAF